jgi:ABC-type transport system involved in multi-copper enzyme maturation permease subunit
MTFLPILVRELRVRARKGATYWTCVGVASAGVLLCLPLLIDVVQSSGSSSNGSYVFDVAVGTAFVLAGSACLLTTAAIATERREGTLGLLFLTPVTSLDVLLGKLGSVGLTSLCALVSFLPVLMIPVLGGGVSGGEAVRKGLVLIDTLFFSLATGLFASTSCLDRFLAGRRAIAILAMGVLGPLLLGKLTDTLLGWSKFPTLLSPVSMLEAASDTHYRNSPVFFWSSFVLLNALIWLLLARATILLRRSMRDDGGGLAALAAAAPQPLDGTATRFTRGLLGAATNPIEWLAFRQRGMKPAVRSAALAGVLLRLGMRTPLVRFVLPGSSSTAHTRIWLPWLAIPLIGGISLAWAASRFFVEDPDIRGSPTLFWSSFVLLSVLIWFLLAGATTLLRRCLRDASGGVNAHALAAAVPQQLDVTEEHSTVTIDATANPIEWLVCRQRGLKLAIWSAAVVAALARSGVVMRLIHFLLPAARPASYATFQLPWLALLLVGAVLLAWVASRFFIKARRTGELELLLTTPLKRSTVVLGQWTALERLLRWPLLLMLTATALSLLTQMRFSWWGAYYSVAMLLNLVHVVLYVAALCWLGLWFGLKARTQASAIAWTVGLVFGVPDLIDMLHFTLLPGPFPVSGGSPNFWQIISFSFWQAVPLLFYIWLIRRAKRHLLAALAGADVGIVDSGFRAAMAAIRKARHWTPREQEEVAKLQHPGSQL